MDVITKKVCKVWGNWGWGGGGGGRALNCRDLWYWLTDHGEKESSLWYHAAFIIFFKNQVLESRRLPSAATVEISRPSSNFQIGYTQSSQMKWSLCHIVERSYNVITSIYSLYYPNPSPEWYKAFARMIVPQEKGNILTVQGPLDTGFQLTLMPENPKCHHKPLIRVEVWGWGVAKMAE